MSVSSPAFAGTSFGIYDARSLAMGGVSVASADNGSAQFYNAALLAFNTETEERSNDSRFWLPLLIPQVSESGFTINELSDDEPRLSIASSIAEFNRTPDPTSAQAVLDATATLDIALADLEGQELFADIYAGVGGGEAGLLRGAGFFLGARWLAGGRPSITPADRTLLAAYQEGLTFVATNGARGIAHPELFDANGDLLNPNSQFDSSISATGAIITEAGVAASRQFQFFGRTVAAGISLKAQRIDTFEDTERIIDDRVDVSQNSDYVGNLNLDIGLAHQLGEHWRIGLAVKDVIPQNHMTALGTRIRLRPRARAGFAYQVARIQIAADIDLNDNEPIGTESSTQELSLGAEWSFARPIKIRAGYRHELRGNRDGIASVGIGTVWKRYAIDVAYALGGDAKAGGVQFGIVF